MKELQIEIHILLMSVHIVLLIKVTSSYGTLATTSGDCSLTDSESLSCDILPGDCEPRPTQFLTFSTINFDL